MAAINLDDHFRDLFENTNDFIYFLTINGEIEIANNAWLTTLGYKSEEVTGRNILDFVHPHYKEKYQKCRQFAIQNNKIKNIEVAFLTRNNEMVISEGEVSCAYNMGEAQYTRCVFKNTTENQRRIKIVRESEKRLQAFLTSGPDAVIIINEYQEILEWNPKAEAIFGFSADEIHGKNLVETIIPFQYREAHLSGMKHFLKTNEGPILNKTVEITALHKSGKEFYVNLSISNVKVDEGWLFIAFISDISARKKTEEALIRKEAELLQSKLQEEKKDQFISIASHELRTPITTIKAYTQLSVSMCKEQDEKLKNNLIKIDQYTNKLNFLLNELLDVSKINLGKLNLSLTEIDFSTFLPEVLNSIQNITATHNIILEENTKAHVIADPVRLEQVITNLISNSAKYSPGCNTILVKSALNQNEIVVSFTDYGIGIANEDIYKIFERFYRVKESSHRFTGFGIGLYVSSEIIKQHNGKMWVNSEKNEGSTFYFSLPVG
ncbi:MAG: PAS domain S-box protein [Ginsengibacter sp.]